MGLLTSTVGSFPKPAKLKSARRKLAEEEIDRGELRVIEDEAVRDVLALQERLGIDLLVDGEMDRGDMTTFFAEKLEGMEISGLVRSYGNRYYRKPVIVGDVRREGPMTVERWRFAQGETEAPVKAILTGPYTLMDWSFDEHYDSREACCMALAEVVREEAADLVAAGVKDLQIDEPAISSRPDDLPLATRALGVVTEGLGSDTRTWTHICYGVFAPVFDRILALPVNGLLLEFANSDFDLLDRLGDLPEGKVIGAGVLDVHTPEVETADQVREGIERVLEVVPPERVWINPDCGLKTRTIDEARGKLEAMMEAVKAVRKQRGL
ncbi:MAG: methionine synthase [Acidobacteriota bacterium]|nr:methionine synthase [Acidobacteriota bacterium]